MCDGVGDVGMGAPGVAAGAAGCGVDCSAYDGALRPARAQRSNGRVGFAAAVASVNAAAGVAVPEVTDSLAGGAATRVPGSAEVNGSLASGGCFTGAEDWSAGTGAGSTGGGVTVPGSGVGAGGSGVTVGVDADGSVVGMPGSAGVVSGGVGAGTSAIVLAGADEASVGVTSVSACAEVAGDEQQQREEDQRRAREKQRPQSTRRLRLRCDGRIVHATTPLQ